MHEDMKKTLSDVVWFGSDYQHLHMFFLFFSFSILYPTSTENIKQQQKTKGSIRDRTTN